MFPVTSAVRASAPIARNVVSRRSMSMYSTIIASPPRNRVSFTEKIIHGILVSAGIMAYPIYVILDVKKIKLERFAREAEEA